MKTFKIILWLTLIILLVIEKVYLHRHGHFGNHSIDGNLGFFVALGLVSVVGILLIGKVIEKFFQVDEDFYDD